MRRLIAVLLAAVVGLTACSSKKDGAPARPKPSGVSAAPSIGAEVTAKVVSDEGCTDTRPYGCWLPLGETPEQAALISPRPINLSVGLDSRCNDTTELRGCWPQPGTVVTVVCQRIVQGEVWVAVFVPIDRVLHPVHDAIEYKDGLLGWNRAQYLRLSAQPSTTCPT